MIDTDDLENNFKQVDINEPFEMSEHTKTLMELTIQQLGITDESSKELIRSMCASMVAEGAAIAMGRVAEKFKLLVELAKKKKK